MKTVIKQIVSDQEADYQDLVKLGEKIEKMASKYNFNNIKLNGALCELMDHIKYYDK